MRKDHSIAGTTFLQTTLEDADKTQFYDGKTNPVVKVVSGPFAQLLPGLEMGHPVTVGQSPAHDFSVSDEQKAVFLVSVSDCSVCDSCAGD